MYRQQRLSRRKLIAAAGLGAAVPVAVAIAGQEASKPARRASTIGPDRGTLWVEENNLARAGGITPDFKRVFTDRTEDWARARDYIGVYMLRSTTLRNPANEITDAFLRDAFLPKLNAWGIDLALDVVGVPLVPCSNRALILNAEAEQIERIRRLGGDVRYLSIQSALSKPSDRCPEWGRNTGYEYRIEGITRYVGFMKERFAGVEVGLIDAMPVKGWEYESIYIRLVETLRAAGLTLDYLHVDFPAEGATAGWGNARAAEEFVRHRLGLRFGITYTSSEGGRTSNRAFHARVLRAYRAFRAAGGRPDDLLLMSWYPHPTVSLPEDSPADYPFMKVALDFARLGGVAPRPPRNATPEPGSPVAEA